MSTHEHKIAKMCTYRLIDKLSVILRKINEILKSLLFYKIETITKRKREKDKEEFA